MMMLSTLAHHGINFVPLGYSHCFKQLATVTEAHGGKPRSSKYDASLTFDLGSPWGAGTFAASNTTRQPSALELEIAGVQGKMFYDTLKRVTF